GAGGAGLPVFSAAASRWPNTVLSDDHRRGQRAGAADVAGRAGRPAALPPRRGVSHAGARSAVGWSPTRRVGGTACADGGPCRDRGTAPARGAAPPVLSVLRVR